MAIFQTKKQSDLEKRLKLLRQQIYGQNADIPTHRYTDTPSHSVPTQSGYLSFRADISYLYHDLTKIGILATAALGVQIILFILFEGR